MIGQATGGNPATSGIYYYDTWNHAIFPAETSNCLGPAQPVAYLESDARKRGIASSKEARLNTEMVSFTSVNKTSF
jgi:hypothetical protein